MKDDEIINKIEKAFADVKYPGDDDLTNHITMNEQIALVKEFRGKTDWRQLDAEFLRQAPDGWCTALAFFSSNALRFYIPAYMIADIHSDLEGANMDIHPEISLCAGLTDRDQNEKIGKMFGGGTWGEKKRENFSSYNAEQVSAVVAYLWWKLESLGGFDRTIEEALLNYWMERDSDG